MNSRELLKEFLLDFPIRLYKFEQSALETGLDMPISTSEIHIISRVGPTGSEKMNVIARKLGVTQATLTSACDKLEAKGLITRLRDPDDKRSVNVRLTPQGLIAYSFHTALMDNLAEGLTSGLTAHEINVLGNKLATIYKELDR